MAKNYSLLQKQVLLALRGDRSQEQINRRLKSNSNQMARWESGRSQITWIEFVELCRIVKAPLQETMKKIVFFEGELKDQKALIQFLSGFSSQKKIAANLGISTSQTSRLLSGKSPLELKAFFRLVDSSSHNLPTVLASLTAPNIPELILEEQSRIAKEKKLHYEKPWVAALLLFLRTNAYKAEGTSKFLAKKLGISEHEIDQIISELESLNVIEKRGGRYHPLISELSTGGSFEGAINIRKFWLNKHLEWMNKSKPGQTHFNGYKIFNIHKDYRKKFEEWFFKVYAELDSLYKEQPHNSVDHVYVFSMAMNNADESLKDTI